VVPTKFLGDHPYFGTSYQYMGKLTKNLGKVPHQQNRRKKAQLQDFSRPLRRLRSLVPSSPITVDLPPCRPPLGPCASLLSKNQDGADRLHHTSAHKLLHRWALSALSCLDRHHCRLTAASGYINLATNGRYAHDHRSSPPRGCLLCYPSSARSSGG
jgi:hypothetical protein